jgi:hypothetical protein
MDHSYKSRKKRRAEAKKLRDMEDAVLNSTHTQDGNNLYHQDFGWILRDGTPTKNAKAYWAWLRRQKE